MAILQHLSDLLGQLFRSNARRASHEAAERAARLEKKVLAIVGNMPTLPETAVRALAMANDPDIHFADFARLIEGDAAIATSLLRIANSVIYASACPAVKLQQAVLRLGLFQCKNLILSIGMKSLLRKMVGSEKERYEVLWHHGYVTAALCRQINRSYRLGFAGEEFFAGLLHDLGRTLLLLADPDCFMEAGGLDFLEEGDLLERERATIGIDHGALGGWFGAHSRLPDDLIQVMKFHHEPDRAEHVRLVTLVAAADHMANHLQRGEDAGTYNPDANAALARLWERWPQARIERFLGELPSMLEQAVQAAACEHPVG